MNLIMKPTFILLAFICCQIFLSCNFNITDNPGPQVSSTIETSKRRGTFICAYTFSEKIINGLQVESFFAEKKYILSEGILGKFEINYYESQLIIRLKDDNTIITLNGIPQNWEISGFKSLNSKIIVKDYKGIYFPDSLAIIVIPDVRNDDIIKKVTLYKVK